MLPKMVVVRKKESSSKTKKEIYDMTWNMWKWNIQKARQDVQYIAGAEFNTEKSVYHYVDDRTRKEGRKDLLKIVSADCVKNNERLQHLLDGSKMLASSEYIARNNRAFMVIAVAWAREQSLIDQNVKKWHILVKSQTKLLWDFEYKRR